LSILQGNSCSTTSKSGEIWTVQTDLQQIHLKFARLLGYNYTVKSQDSHDDFKKTSIVVSEIARHSADIFLPELPE